LAPKLHIVRVNSTSAESGIYICSSPRGWGELQILKRAPECAGRWRGVVFCERAGADCEDWGDNGLRIGPLLLFGDPSLLLRIRSEIGQGGRVW
jgi:hypothetical protein